MSVAIKNHRTSAGNSKQAVSKQSIQLDDLFWQLEIWSRWFSGTVLRYKSLTWKQSDYRYIRSRLWRVHRMVVTIHIGYGLVSKMLFYFVGCSLWFQRTFTRGSFSHPTPGRLRLGRPLGPSKELVCADMYTNHVNISLCMREVGSMSVV